MTEKHKSVSHLFENAKTIKKIKDKMPYLFQLAEVESSRAGKVGMEVGSVRERIIIALLMSEFGESNVNANIPITEKEIDCYLYSEPISIKTISGDLGGVKLIWTVDAESAKRFRDSYYPEMSILLSQIRWGRKAIFSIFQKTHSRNCLIKSAKKII